MMKKGIGSAKHGFGLLEMILVFVLVLGAIAVVFALFIAAKPSAKASTATEELSLLSSNAIAAYSVVPHDYAGLSNASLIAAHAVPLSMLDGDGSDGKILSPWDVPIQIAVVPTDPRSFQIAYPGIPGDACVKFLSNAAVLFRQVGISTTDTSIRANSGDVSQPAIISACSTSPVPPTIYFTNS